MPSLRLETDRLILLYQLNLDGREDRIYRKDWDLYTIRFIEDLQRSFYPRRGRP